MPFSRFIEGRSILLALPLLDYILGWEYRFRSMKLNELAAALNKYPGTFPRFLLPDGHSIPRHAHVTEVGHLTRNFIDCGGVIGRNESAVLQTHVGNDTDHRLTSERLARILQLGDRLLPHPELDVEVEYRLRCRLAVSDRPG